MLWLAGLVITCMNCKYTDPRNENQTVNDSLFYMAKKGKKGMPYLKDEVLYEASGLEFSDQNDQMFWVHNDSGDEARIFLVDTTGELKMVVYLDSVDAVDWEDLAVANGEIYLSDMGDNMGQRPEVYIHHISEPVYTGLDSIRIARKDIETMTIRYTNGPRDSETLLYDYRTNELVVVTKRELNAFVYSFPFKKSQKPTMIKPAGTIPLNQFTAGDANEAGEILLKNYDAIFYWSASDQSIPSRLIQGPECSLPYQVEPQGEAICWADNGFYTVSEHNIYTRQYLYFYKRKEDLAK